MIPIALLATRVVPPPVGEAVLTAASGAWICPPGVTRVSAVCVGRGGSGVAYGAQNSAGAGGALAYKNDIPVVPGTAYNYTVGNTSIFGMTAGAGAGGVQANYSSTPGGTASGGDANFSGGGGASAFGTAIGGGAATYTGDGGFAGAAGIGLHGIGATGSYGYGGNSVFSGSAGAGGPGAIRVMWGPGRSFPNNAQ